jgi:hypothetical protein
LAALGEFSGATERSGEAADVDWIVRRLEKRAPKAAPARRELWASFFRFPTLAVVTASLVILVSGGLYIESLREPAVAPGSGREANVMRSTKIRAIAPAGDLRQVPRTFNWEPMAGAVRYEVSVAEVDRNQVWSADAGGPGTDIPPIVSRLIVPRKTLAWQVAAFDGRGARLGESDWISFRLVP